MVDKYIDGGGQRINNNKQNQ